MPYPTRTASTRTKPTPPTSPKGEAFCTSHFTSANNALARKTLKAQSSPLGEDARRAEEVQLLPARGLRSIPEVNQRGRKLPQRIDLRQQAPISFRRGDGGEVLRHLTAPP